MAKFKNVLPTSLIKEFETLNINTEKMMMEMTEAGAKKVEQNIRANAPSGIKREPKIMNKLKVSRSYKTPSDGGINTQTAFYFEGNDGYYKKGDKDIPIPLILNAFEYGTSERYTKKGAFRGKIKKQPFLRKSFNKRDIESAMLRVQEKYIKGD